MRRTELDWLRDRARDGFVGYLLIQESYEMYRSVMVVRLTFFYQRDGLI